MSDAKLPRDGWRPHIYLRLIITSLDGVERHWSVAWRNPGWFGFRSFPSDRVPYRWRERATAEAYAFVDHLEKQRRRQCQPTDTTSR